ncbi:RHS repeat domain-containing protein [Pseudidiomarina woesei]|uniref:RHS repeat domain-containing protein n=1 Tax=Pseudidiomarina woesei TaxID=1381080 RepID=UPI0014704CB5|nr:RHS repeat-associated core domain-containing protein [Pseudidiomarina woesei]
MQRESASTSTEATYLLFKDHLGSVFTTLATTGEIISQQLFSAFGQTRTIYTAGGVALGSMLPPTEQGFTEHRQMDALGIVHMKGRIYDPTLGRFLQADPFVQAPKNSQNYNRYSYVLKNPMSYTDPSGYFFKALFDGIKKYWRQIVSIAVMFIPGINVIAAGFISGYIATGSLKGAIIGAFTAGMAGPANTLGGFITNGVVGGLASKAMGGKFGHGFWSAGIGASLSGSINGIKSAFGRVFASAVVGGTISKITGGKFANGAFGAAFARTLGEARAGKLGSSKSGASDDNTFANSNREALDAELADLNVKAKEHGLFTGKNGELDAAKWLNENGGHLQDKYGAEIGANIYENHGGHSIGKIVTSYHSNFVDLSDSLNMFPHKFGQVADWHTHSNGSHYASWGQHRDSHKSYYRAYVSSVSSGATSMSLYNPATARSTWPITRQSYESALTCVVGSC